MKCQVKALNIGGKKRGASFNNFRELLAGRGDHTWPNLSIVDLCAHRGSKSPS
jgi:hypothetical protein